MDSRITTIVCAVPRERAALRPAYENLQKCTDVRITSRPGRRLCHDNRTTEPGPPVIRGLTPGSKNAVMVALVMRPQGATHRELRAATGWANCLVAMRRAADRANVLVTTVAIAGQPARFKGLDQDTLGRLEQINLELERLRSCSKPACMPVQHHSVRGSKGQTMAKPEHPADIATREAIGRATHFVVSLLVDRQQVAHELKTLPQARQAGELMRKAYQSRRLAIVHAVTPEGRSFMVPPDWSATETATMGVTTMTMQEHSEPAAIAAPVPALKVHSIKSNARRAARHAGLDPDTAVIPAEGGWVVCPPQGRAAVEAATPAADAGKPAMNGPDLSIPPELQRPRETPAQRAALDAKVAASRIPKTPRGELSNPPAHASAGAAALGMSPLAMREAGAKLKSERKGRPEPIGRARKRKAAPKAPAAPRKPAGERSRYDWTAAAELAAKGKLPPPLDFSADTHKPYRAKLATVIELAKAGDAKALRAVEINPTSSSPKALARYRDLCVAALKVS